MKIRYKSPGGNGILEVSDDATVGTIYQELKKKTALRTFTVKYGLPMAMKTISIDQTDELAKSFGLNRETLTIVPEDMRSDSEAVSIPPRLEGSINSGKNDKNTDQTEDIVIPWPERQGTLLLRIMPSDNSCLFTAFGGALPQQIPPHKLRRMMSDFIQEHPDEYSEAILGSPSDQYCRRIMDPDCWGGGIELSILSSIFETQICTYDIQNKSLITFGEDKSQRCFLIYSGIHYDRAAFSYSEYPYTSPTLPPEMDRTIWPVEDAEVTTKVKALVEKLHQAHYYTDVQALVLKCNVSGCGWIGSGQAEGRKHAELTGHVELSEIEDIMDGETLQQCNAPGCQFIGVGSQSRLDHRRDTGHKSFSIIPDI